MATPVAKNEPEEDGDVNMAEASGASSPKELRMALYAQCASLEEGRVFTQEDLLAFNIVPGNDVEQLNKLTNHLITDALFKLMTKDGKVCWKVVKKADAVK